MKIIVPILVCFITSIGTAAQQRARFYVEITQLASVSVPSAPSSTAVWGSEKRTNAVAQIPAKSATIPVETMETPYIVVSSAPRQALAPAVHGTNASAVYAMEETRGASRSNNTNSTSLAVRSSITPSL